MKAVLGHQISGHIRTILFASEVRDYANFNSLYRLKQLNCRQNIRLRHTQYMKVLSRPVIKLRAEPQKCLLFFAVLVIWSQNCPFDVSNIPMLEKFVETSKTVGPQLTNVTWVIAAIMQNKRFTYRQRYSHANWLIINSINVELTQVHLIFFKSGYKF